MTRQTLGSIIIAVMALGVARQVGVTAEQIGYAFATFAGLWAAGVVMRVIAWAEQYR